MTVLERIKQLCKEHKNISITILEQELGYSNGSLSKAKDIPSSRILEISEYFNVSMNYLMTGKNFIFTPEMAEIDGNLFYMDKIIKDYALKLNSLNNDERKLVFNLIDGLAGKKEE